MRELGRSAELGGPAACRGRGERKGKKKKNREVQGVMWGACGHQGNGQDLCTAALEGLATPEADSSFDTGANRQVPHELNS